MAPNSKGGAAELTVSASCRSRGRPNAAPIAKVMKGTASSAQIQAKPSIGKRPNAAPIADGETRSIDTSSSNTTDGDRIGFNAAARSGNKMPIARPDGIAQRA